jgi:hypothetical protein
MNPLQSALALALIAFLPGFLLVKALFPRRPGEDFDGVMQLFMSVTLSVVLTILVGTTLGFLPHGDGRGYFQGSETGAPFIELSLGALSLALFVAALYRGAFPRLSKKLGLRVPAPPADAALVQPAPPAASPALSTLLGRRVAEHRLARAIRRERDPARKASLEAELARARSESRRVERGAADEMGRA